MARSSYPQQGLFPGDGPDCGPYTADEWRAWMLTAMRAGGMVNTGAAAPPGLPATPLYPNVGVFYVCPDRLLVEENPANTIRIGTGAWLCDGTFGYNDTQITGIVPAVGPRTDYVVVRQNYSGADFNTGPAGAALTVTDNTADITIINSVNFTQNQDRLTYWDIPLASYDIDGAGVITNLVDLREWVDAETKRFFSLVQTGRDSFTPADLIARISHGVELANAVITHVYTFFAVPNDFISGMVLTPIVIESAATGAGNIAVGTWVHHYTCGELFTVHTPSVGLVAHAMANVANTTHCVTVAQLPLPAATTGDIVHVDFERDGNDAADTFAFSAYTPGILVEYFGWGRK